MESEQCIATASHDALVPSPITWPAMINCYRGSTFDVLAASGCVGTVEKDFCAVDPSLFRYQPYHHLVSHLPVLTTAKQNSSPTWNNSNNIIQCSRLLYLSHCYSIAWDRLYNHSHLSVTSPMVTILNQFWLNFAPQFGTQKESSISLGVIIEPFITLFSPIFYPCNAF